MSKVIGEISDRYVNYIFEDHPVFHGEIGVVAVNTMPTSILPVRVAEGWTATLQEALSNENQDVYLSYAEQGYFLTEHVHLQHEVIEVLQGELSVWIDGEKQVVKEGGNVEIESYVPHAACSESGDALIRVTFIPPITRKIKKNVISPISEKILH